MTVGISSIDEVLSRIAAIQAQFAPQLAARSTTSSGTTAAAGSAFASTLASTQTAPGAQSGTTQNPSGTVNGVTYSAGSANVTGADVVQHAQSYLGVPYIFAGTTRSGMDCSGLVQTAYKELGISLPRISWEQQKVGTEVPSLAQAQPGDVLCFGNPAYHVALYLGNGKMIQAPEPGKNVEISDVSPAPSSIRRIVSAGSESTATAGVSAGGTTAAAGYPSGVSAYSSLMATDEAKYGLPTGLLGAVAQVESGGNPTAVSPAGAQGLMQLMPGTARSLGVDPLVPSQAVDGAARMLAGLLQKYHGSLDLTLAAYNAGPGAVDSYGGIPPYAETQAYVVKVKKFMPGTS